MDFRQLFQSAQNLPQAVGRGLRNTMDGDDHTTFGSGLRYGLFGPSQEQPTSLFPQQQPQQPQGLLSPSSSYRGMGPGMDGEPLAPAAPQAAPQSPAQQPHPSLWRQADSFATGGLFSHAYDAARQGNYGQAGLGLLSGGGGGGAVGGGGVPLPTGVDPFLKQTMAGLAAYQQDAKQKKQAIARAAMGGA